MMIQTPKEATVPSWVETTCPPGWRSIQMFGSGRWVPLRVALPDEHDDGGGYLPVRDGDGCEVYCATESVANRLAWERWALEVLGDRVVWDWWEGEEGDDAGPMLIAGDVCLMQVTWGGRAGFAAWDGDGEDFRERTHSHDPVEALARLASLTIAELGPIGQDTEEKSDAENMDAQSKGEGGNP